MEEKVCPICGSSYCVVTPCTWYRDDDDLCANEIKCDQGIHFIVHNSVDYGEPIEVRRRYNMIYALLLKTPEKEIHGFKYPFKFFYEESSIGQPISEAQKVNLANSMRDYPKSVMDRVDQCLVNLSRKYPRVGQLISLESYDARLFFCVDDDVDSEIGSIGSFMRELKYTDGLSRHIITAKGWEKIYELTKGENEIQQGFIAMSFGDDARSIGEIFAEIIDKCGYAVQRIDLKEHNNQIVPEIFFEIRRSKFLVVDVTYPNYGAYYEAGYGEALGKQVIVCCSKAAFDSKDRPHFDIAQKSMVIWDDEEDLRKKLHRRIEATVGLNK